MELFVVLCYQDPLNMIGSTGSYFRSVCLDSQGQLYVYGGNAEQQVQYRLLF